MLHHAFPTDLIVGEEDAKDLRVDSGRVLRDRIVELANEALTAELELGDAVEWGIGPGQQKTAEELLDAIDRGNYDGGRTGREFRGHSLLSGGIGSLNISHRNVDD